MEKCEFIFRSVRILDVVRTTMTDPANPRQHSALFPEVRLKGITLLRGNDIFGPERIRLILSRKSYIVARNGKTGNRDIYAIRGLVHGRSLMSRGRLAISI